MACSQVNSRPLSDRTWAAIVAARGAVQGKALHMRADTLGRLLWERGIMTPGSHVQGNPHLHGRTVYGVRVVLDPLMKFGEMELR